MKRREVYRLLQVMDELYAGHAIDDAITIAKQILSKNIDDQYGLEQIATLFIDNGMSVEAQQALVLLKKGGQETGYHLFLQCRIDYLQKDYEATISHGEAALRKTDMQPWQQEMVRNILGRAYRELGLIDKSLEYYRVAGGVINDGFFTSSLGNIRSQNLSNYLFTLHYSDIEREDLYREAKRYDALYYDITHYEHGIEKHQHKKLRIGYISPDLCRHVVAFFSYSLFKSYDKNVFAIYAYANNEEDDVSREYAAAVDVWRNIRYMDPLDVAKLIVADEIDILVDLAGHTADNCLPVLAYRPAPVQLSGIGWFDTTGLSTVDYFLADNYTDPVGMNDPYFTEKLLRLAHSHFCYMWHDAPPTITMSAYRRKGYITFGSFNNFTKVNDAVLAVWAKILQQVPESKLFLKAGILGVAYGRQLAEERLQRAGIPLNRIILEAAEANYLPRYQEVDIALDTWPYPGGGTTCDALYMGVPVVTLVGDRHNSRFGYSILMNMGLPELCAQSEEEYIAIAVALSSDPAVLSHLHQTLRRRMRQSPVMDEGLYMTEIEDAYRQIWNKWLQSQGESAVDGIGAVGQAKKFLQQGGALGAKRAIPWLRQAIAAEPNVAEYSAMLSEACHAVQDYDGEYRAIKAAIDKARKSESDYTRSYWSDIYCRLGYAALTRGEHVEAFEAYREAWQYAEGRRKISLYDSLLLAAHYLDFTTRDMYELHRAYAQHFEGIVPYNYGKAYSHKKIRIGYLSPDFRLHVMFAIYYGLLSCYDRTRFEVTCYSLSAIEDGYTEAIRGQVNRFVSVVGKSYAEIAELIHADEIDVLVDLAGHSANSGLPVLAWKPAPVQISGLGYLATTGLDTVDYYLTDAIVDPVGEHDTCFTEKLLYLPSHFSYAARSDVSVPQAAPCLQNGYITFGVFNHYRKITDDMLRAWKNIMEQVPESRLLLKSQELGSDSLVDCAYQRMRAIGFDMERVQFEAATLDYMERYLDIDIALDTYPYNGGGTTLDALYMGVPVITRYGDRRNTRFGLSILTAVGIEDLAAADIRVYIERAVSLAGDRDLLNLLHKNLRNMMLKSPIMQIEAYVRRFEAELQEIMIR